MTVAILILAATVGLLVAVLAVHLFRAAPTLRGREVTVNTCRPDDQTLRGTVVSDSERWLVLSGASYVNGQGETPIEGPATRIPAANVAFVQEH